MMTPGKLPSPAAVTMTKERIEWAMPKNGWITQIIEIKAPTFLDDDIKEAAKALSRGYTSDVRAHLKKK
mgnify:CR=1 FL=1